MSRLLCLLSLLILIPAFAFSQNPQNGRDDQTVQPASPPVQVVYVLDNATLTTYNIDPQTFQPAVVGTTTMPLGKYSSFVTSPNGQFLYYLENSTYYRANQKLYVYDTNAQGVPGSAPVQGTPANQLLSIVVNPQNTFLYSLAIGSAGPQTTPFTIVRNVINPSTGALSQPVTEATYMLDNDPSGNDCGLEVLGFNPAGTTMYDEIFCTGPHGSGSETFNQRTVDLQTGALGPDEQVYAFSFYAGSGYAAVQFENNLLFAFDQFFDEGPNANLVDIYQTQPINSTPLVNCGASMLAICGNYVNALAHPSGEYVFLGNGSFVTDVLQVDLTTQQLVQVSTVPGNVEKFSPDGSVIYGYNPAPRYIHIAGFNAGDGQITLGGTIELPNAINDFWATSERY